MIDELNEIMEEMNNSTLFETIAKSYRKMHNALIAEDFTEEEAMTILVSQGLNVNK